MQSFSCYAAWICWLCKDVVLYCHMANLVEIITKEMELRNYSRRTIDAYSRVYLDIYKSVKKPLRNLTTAEITEYLYKKQQSGLSSQSIALAANALNFLYIQIYQVGDFRRIRHPKKNQQVAGGID